MNSLGTSSKWPSYDSLSSTPSLLLSESEHTEDEADVFSSEGEGEVGGSQLFSVGEGKAVSGIHFAFVGPSGPSGPPCVRSESGPAERRPDRDTHPASAPSPSTTTLGSSSSSQGDLAFAQKCADLQRFIRPLLDLLNGLKTGRFDRGLTSFQQSVAMDRLQRILGILQKPDMGEKYLRTLLQVEMMLKVWFPQMASQSSVPLTQSTTPSLSLRWRQNQMHIPVKKRKFSWVDSDPSSINLPHCKRHQQNQLESCQAGSTHGYVSTCLPGASTEQSGVVEWKHKPDKCQWTSGHEFTQGPGNLDRPVHLCSRKENGNWKPDEISPPSSSPATQGV